MTRRLAFLFAHLLFALSLQRPSLGAPACDASLWDHVFTPKRLIIVEPCVVYRGILVLPVPQFDGDYHIMIRPDPGFESFEPSQPLFNVEVMCVVPVLKSAAAAETCASWHQDIVIPPPGAHVEIVGAYVMDGSHGWHEIHPVTSITVLPVP